MDSANFAAYRRGVRQEYFGGHFARCSLLPLYRSRSAGQYPL